eukprot:403376529
MPKSANLTRDTEIFSKMDPYVVIKIGNQEKKSLVHNEGGKHPRWNETFMFDITNETCLNITVMDKDMVNDDIVGSTNVPLDATFRSGKTSSSYNLSYKGKQAGQLYIDMEFYNHSHLGQPQSQLLPGQHSMMPGQIQGGPSPIAFNVGLGMQQQYMQPMGYYMAPQPYYGMQQQMPMPQQQFVMPPSGQYPMQQQQPVYQAPMGMPPVGQNMIQPQPLPIPNQVGQPQAQQFYPQINQMQPPQYFPQQNAAQVPPGYNPPQQMYPPQNNHPYNYQQR